MTTETIDQKRERLARERAERRKNAFTVGSRAGDHLRDGRTADEYDGTCMGACDGPCSPPAEAEASE